MSYFFDAKKKELHRSTGLRVDSPNDTAKAKALRAELEAKEHHRVPVVNSEGWDTWVPKYLERHCESPLTLERYLDAWKWLALWLQIQRLHSPRAITYRNALEYECVRSGFPRVSEQWTGYSRAVTGF